MKDTDYLVLIGKNITKIRKQKGMTIEALADKCNMEKSNLIPVEKGRVNVTVNTLVRIANALEVPLKEMLKD